MTRTTTLAAAAAIAVLVPATARAQFIIGASAGPAFPIGSFADAYNLGYQGTVSLALGVPAFPLGFRAEGSYAHFPANRTLIGGLTTPAVRIISGTANIVYGIPAPVLVSPYLIGGVGAYNVNCTEDGCSGSTKLGFNGGLGVKFGLAGVSIFVEGRVHHVQASDGVAAINYVPVTVGLTF